MRIIRVTLIFLLILSGISFACLNASTVTINYYIGNTSAPLSLILVLVLGTGLLLGLIIAIPKHFKLKNENSRLKKRIKVTAKEIESLR